MYLRKRMSFLFMLLVLLIAVPAAAYFSHSGTIPHPRPYVHTVKCNPGQTFRVKVNTDHPSTVNIVYRVLTSAGWAGNKKAGSQNKTSHYLSYTAPNRKPDKNMAYWHYDVSIHNATNKRTKFTVEIN